MTDELPPSWSRERTDSYRPTPNAPARRFATYRHESGDVVLRVAPTMLDPTERPGYELSATVYPGLEFETRTVVRTVTTYDRCERLARTFTGLFEGALDRPAEAEAAVEYATSRVQPSGAPDAVIPDSGSSGGDEDKRERV